MERTLHPGELTRTDFALATAEDDAEVRALLRDVPMAGGFRLGFAREPSVFACPTSADEKEHILVARRAGRLLCMGSWSEREVWLGGEREQVGYLHGLRMVPGIAGSMHLLRAGYSRLADEVSRSTAVGWFTSIAATNLRARRVLECRRSGLPRYLPITDYLTRVIPISNRGPDVGRVGLESVGELNDFLNREGSRHDLALTWSEKRWQALALSGFTLDDIVVVRRRDRIVAAAGVWDQSAWKQVIIHDYPAWLEWLRPAAAIGAACVGWPGLPRPGAVVPLASVFPFAVAAGCESVLPELWRGLAARARKRRISWLALGLQAADPIWHHLPSFGISYRTILYWVCGAGLSGPPATGGARIIRPECATL